MKDIRQDEIRGRTAARRLVVSWEEGEPSRPLIRRIEGRNDGFPWPGIRAPGCAITRQLEKAMNNRKQIAIATALVLLAGCTQNDQTLTERPSASADTTRGLKEPHETTPPPGAVVATGSMAARRPSPPPSSPVPTNPLPVLPTNELPPLPTNSPPEAPPANPPPPPGTNVAPN